MYEHLSEENLIKLCEHLRKLKEEYHRQEVQAQEELIKRKEAMLDAH